MDYYHATAAKNVAGLLAHGFRLPYFIHRDEELKHAGCMGHGVYVSRDWKTALWFQPALFRVRLAPGTRVLDVSAPPDMRVIDRLRREFHRDLLADNARFHTIIPKNKHLTGAELIELTKYHYHRTWGQGERKRFHGRSLNQCLSRLRRHQYHGFGHATSDVGLMILAPERVIVQELVGVADPFYDDQGVLDLPSLEALRRYFQRHGQQSYPRLAEQLLAEAPSKDPENRRAGGSFVRQLL